MKSKGVLIVVVLAVLLGVAYVVKKQRNVTVPIQTSLNASPTPDANDNPETAAEATPAPALPKSAQGLSPKDQRKMVILQQILASRNDNDPRMDSELNNLSPEVKRAMVGYYNEIPSEKRNDRGTIVFLIGRKITQKSDVDFIKKVMMEKPCLSLSDCSKLAPPASGEAAHLEGISETTASYPQIMGIRQLVDQYRAIQGDETADKSLATGILQALKEAEHSPNPKAASDAEAALRYLTGRR